MSKASHPGTKGAPSMITIRRTYCSPHPPQTDWGATVQELIHQRCLERWKLRVCGRWEVSFAIRGRRGVHVLGSLFRILAEPRQRTKHRLTSC